ncbi:hypothetical protein TNCV_541891 [Trichonephila clavipes]|nr:hypothetical protein TNCV_541891 [Trichonephila clavipes]
MPAMVGYLNHWATAAPSLMQDLTSLVFTVCGQPSGHDYKLEALLLACRDDCGSLVLKVMDSRPACHEFKPSTAEDPLCREGRFTLNLSRLKRSPFGEVWKLGEGVPPQVSSSRHLTMVQNDEVRHQKSSSNLKVRRL